MSSALDALLEAARYIELQEQHGFRDGWIQPPLNNSSSSDIQHNNSLRNTNNDTSNSINNHITNNSINNNQHNNHNQHNSRGNDYIENNNIIRRNENFLFQQQHHHRNNANNVDSNSENTSSNNNSTNNNNNINGNRILSPTLSPTNQNQIVGINIKPYVNSNAHNNNNNNQNDIILNSRTIEDRIENGHIEIITNGRQRHNSSSSIKSGINLNMNNNSTNNNNNNNIITTTVNSSNNTNSTHAIMSTTTEDSSQSSLNLSSSSYLSGSPNNNHNSSSSSILNSDNLLPFQLTSSSSMITTAASSTGSGRRRTISNTSDGSRNSSTVRPGTREIHNKLEKHRRAHLKECFEQLKVQLQLKDEEKKKTSNLAILGAAYRHVMALRRKEKELEQQVELLAKEKINAQKKIVSLKRELVSKYDNIDFSSIVSDGNTGTTIVNSLNSICNVNNNLQQQQQQQHHQIAPLNLNRTSSPQTMLLSPTNNTNNKVNLNNDIIINPATATKDIIAIENNKNVMQSGRKIHHQYSIDKPRDLTINSSHKVIIQSNNNYNNNLHTSVTNSITPTTTTTTNLNIKEDPDHPTQKVIKQYNLIALAPVDKDNKIISSASLPMPQVVTTGGGLVIPMLSSQALRVIGPNNLSTIEFSTPSLQNHIQNSIPSLASGPQLQKLFINGDCTGAATISAHPALAAAAAAAAAAASTSNENKNGITTTEINRLPGGAELNILPASVTGATTLFRGNEKLTFVNNAITLKSSTGGSAATVAATNNNSSRAVHVVTTSNHQNSTVAATTGTLTPIVVSQGPQVNNLTQLIGTNPQLGKMNISLAGHHHHHHHHRQSGDTQTLLNATQYIHAGPMKQMVVAVANNATPTNNNSSNIQTKSTIETIGKI